MRYLFLIAAIIIGYATTAQAGKTCTTTCYPIGGGYTNCTTTCN